MIKSKIKQTIVNGFQRILEQPHLEQWFNQINWKRVDLLNQISNQNSPYFDYPSQAILDKSQAVFITSRFRSGSTLLWNIFRQEEGFTSFYEPFNERQWFNLDKRGSFVDKSHRGVSDYWTEYEKMSALTKMYNEEWIRHNLYLDKTAWQPEMRSFIDGIISESPNRPVLQFNRIDFRLPWLRHIYPNAKFIHLFRHPRDQFCSFLTDKKLMNKDDLETHYVDNFPFPKRR
jgi:hypothetical protein